MSVSNVPATVANLDLPQVIEALARHGCNVTDAAVDCVFRRRICGGCSGPSRSCRTRRLRLSKLGSTRLRRTLRRRSTARNFATSRCGEFFCGEEQRAGEAPRLADKRVCWRRDEHEHHRAVAGNYQLGRSQRPCGRRWSSFGARSSRPVLTGVGDLTCCRSWPSGGSRFCRDSSARLPDPPPFPVLTAGSRRIGTTPPKELDGA